MTTWWNHPINRRYCHLSNTWYVLGDDGWSYTVDEFLDLLQEQIPERSRTDLCDTDSADR